MNVPRWTPPVEPSKREQLILKRMGKVRTLMPFLRRHRHELFDDGFQAELEKMYRGTGAGKDPRSPAMLAMATLLQGYLNVSDAMIVELTALDLSVQCVLDCVGAEQTAFSQGAFHDFRLRLIEHDMDIRLLERTVELARATGEFDAKKLPKSLRIGIDSSPLQGAGRVEDTLNLLAHAGRDIARCAATVAETSFETVCQESGAVLLLESSIKKALDLDWTRPGVRNEGLRALLSQLEKLVSWVTRRLPEEATQPPLQEALATLDQIKTQDLEPDPNTPGSGARIKQGVAKDRRVSITDRDMRHGRKNKNKPFSGYKRHIATDLDTQLIHAAAVTPANVVEHMAAEPLKLAIEALGFTISELYIDRGYLSSPVVQQMLAQSGDVFCRPWASTKPGIFSKLDFHFNLRDRLVACPAGVEMPFIEGAQVHFPAELCAVCPLRADCTKSKNGRTLTVAEDERFQEQLRRALRTRSGRARLRHRTGVEHRLAKLSNRSGTRARYRGIRKNEFALRRSSAVLNLEVLNRRQPSEIRSISNRSAS
jgi:IS5 family transposase